MVCGHHTLVRKNGMGNLQKGEGYVSCILFDAWNYTDLLTGTPIWILLSFQLYLVQFSMSWCFRTIYVASGHVMLQNASLNYHDTCKSTSWCWRPPSVSSPRCTFSTTALSAKCNIIPTTYSILRNRTLKTQRDGGLTSILWPQAHVR